MVTYIPPTWGRREVGGVSCECLATPPDNHSAYAHLAWLSSCTRCGQQVGRGNNADL